MRDKRLEKVRKGVTTLVVIALAAAVSYAVTGVLVSHSPAFALTANKDFSITGQLYASTCTETPGAELYPGVTRCLAVTVHNPLSGVAIDVRSLSMTVTSFTHTPSNPDATPACTTTMLSAPTLFTSNFVVPAGTTHTIDKPIQLSTTGGTQDACEDGTFHFGYTGTATYTDRAKASLTASLTTTGSATLSATVTPVNASSDPYGPATAPVHHVTFYSCGTTATCTSKSLLGTVTLTTSTGTTKVATATMHVSGLSTPGTYSYEVSYPAKGTHTGTFTGSSSSISITVTD